MLAYELLDASQKEAIEKICNGINSGMSETAIKGYAGTGKSTIMFHLARELQETGWAVDFVAPTNKAVDVLKKKGVQEPQTVYSAMYAPAWHPDLVKAFTELGRLHAMSGGEPDNMTEDMLKQLPTLVGVVGDVEHIRRGLKAYYGSDENMLCMKVAGINTWDYLLGWEPRNEPKTQTVAIVDEASMLPEPVYNDLISVYPAVVLVGDGFQLPPVKAKAALHIPALCATLTTIHRQDNRIVDMAHSIRQMDQPVQLKQFAGEDVSILTAGDWIFDYVASKAPMITWTNKSRISFINTVRNHFGHTSIEPQVGEPLIVRENRQKPSLVTNATGIVESRDSEGYILLKLEGSEQKFRHFPYMEDYNEIPRPFALPLRYGYAATAHTTQGGEWPVVMVDIESFSWMRNVPYFDNAEEEARRWLYTAVTRASKKVVIVTGLQKWLKTQATSMSSAA